MAKNKAKKVAKARNYHALNAIIGRKTGRFTDRKKEASRKACRGKVN